MPQTGILLTPQQNNEHQMWRSRSNGSRFDPRIQRRISCCQFALAITILIFLYIVLLIVVLYATDTLDTLYQVLEDGSDDVRTVTQLEKYSAEQSYSTTPKPADISIEKLPYIHNPSVCDGTEYFSTIIHSNPHHFTQREVIRKTWGQVKTIDDDVISLVFILGQPASDSERTQSLIDKESAKYGDIVQAEFKDSYKNLTIKHLLGYTWAVKRCPKSKFVLKADDDAFIDIRTLHSFIKRIHGNGQSQTIICNVMPAGTAPHRQGKWAISTDEYSSSRFPRYCSGLAYLTKPSTAARLLAEAESSEEKLWIDDVFVTGILAEKANLDYYYMNLRYTYDEKDYGKWLENKYSSSNPPYIIGHMNTSKSDWEDRVYRMWTKTEKSHGIAVKQPDVIKRGEVKEVVKQQLSPVEKRIDFTKK